MSLAVVAFIVACDGGRSCTLIGCVNSLIIEIENAPAGPITVHATPVGTPDTVRTVTCPGDTGCTNTVHFAGFSPVHVHLTIITTAGTRRWDVRPDVHTTQPNGPGCPEICRYGTVRLRWQ